MKRLLLGSLSAFALVLAVAPAGKAATPQTTPVNLVNLARNGYFRVQGIPSFARLSQEIATGQVAPEDIVKAAVQARRVSPEVLTDRGYLSAVAAELDRITLPVE